MPRLILPFHSDLPPQQSECDAIAERPCQSIELACQTGHVSSQHCILAELWCRKEKRALSSDPNPFLLLDFVHTRARDSNHAQPPFQATHPVAFD